MDQENMGMCFLTYFLFFKCYIISLIIFYSFDVDLLGLISRCGRPSAMAGPVGVVEHARLSQELVSMGPKVISLSLKRV